MKPLVFLGNSLEELREFPEDAKHDAGYQLDRVQRGLLPNDYKPMPAIGPGVQEIRVWDDSGTFLSHLHSTNEQCCLCSARLSKKDARDGKTRFRFSEATV